MLIGGMQSSEALDFINQCIKNIINLGHTLASSSGS